ncbi:hypothetical protein R5R35_002656 [Gryllus longicercus]|uniref:G-protein coupled receptors family 1 profile domain-containing protein n=1 Tax=Gryllus longicercus TaxID=2509291 RepID=A0AAN9VZ57_9ORTH
MDLVAVAASEADVVPAATAATAAEAAAEAAERAERDARDERLAAAELATLGAVLALTLAGNGAVLCALGLRRHAAGGRRLPRMLFFICHLCVADLLSALLNVLPQLAWDATYRFRGGPVLCKAVKLVQPLGAYLSAYLLVATALDRHHAICRPLTYSAWSSRRARLLVRLAWAAAALSCAPQLAVFSYQRVAPDGPLDCWATFSPAWGQQAYVTWYCVSSFIVPLLVLTATYARICRRLWLRGRGGVGPAGVGAGSGARAPVVSRAKVRTVQQTVAVIALFVLCSAPFTAALLCAAWDPRGHHSAFYTGAAFTIMSLLSSLNSCANPWIFLAFNAELRGLLARACLRAGGWRGGGGGRRGAGSSARFRDFSSGSAGSASLLRASAASANGTLKHPRPRPHPRHTLVGAGP